MARTTDTNYNIIRVGDEIARIFQEMGIAVIHDKTLHDSPSYNDAYDNARTGIEGYLEQYPTIQMVLTSTGTPWWTTNPSCKSTG